MHIQIEDLKPWLRTPQKKHFSSFYIHPVKFLKNNIRIQRFYSISNFN